MSAEGRASRSTRGELHSTATDLATLPLALHDKTRQDSTDERVVRVSQDAHHASGKTRECRAPTAQRWHAQMIEERDNLLHSHTHTHKHTQRCLVLTVHDDSGRTTRR